jgi:hypothetical protein
MRPAYCQLNVEEIRRCKEWKNWQRVSASKELKSSIVSADKLDVDLGDRHNIDPESVSAD